MSFSTNTPRGFDEIIYPTVRAGSVAEAPNNKISSKELGALNVFHFSIPNVQEFGDGQWESGDSIDSDKWLVSSESVLISKLNPRKSTVCIARPRNALTISSTEFVAFDSGGGHDNKFLYYVLGSGPVTSYLSSLTTSVTRSHQRVQPSDIKSMRIPWPHSKRRRQIADYLDHETAEIDAFILDLERFSSLLREELSAARFQLFSRPSNEDPVPLKRLAKQISGSGFPHEYQGDSTQELPFFKVGSLKNAQDGQLVGADNTITRSTAIRLGATIFPRDTIILAKIGAALFLNRSAIIMQPSCIDNNMLGLIPNRGVNAEFLRGVISIMDLGPLANPGAVPSLNMTWYREQPVWLPTYHRQREVTEKFTRTRIRISLISDEVGRAIDLARERRAALITAAVTGQIDVTAKNKPAAEQLEDDIAQGRHRESA